MRLKALKIGTLVVPMDNVRNAIAVSPSIHEPDRTHWHVLIWLAVPVTCPCCDAVHVNAQVHWHGDGAQDEAKRFEAAIHTELERMARA